MARLFTCGFELQDMTTAAPKEWGVASGTPVVGPPSISTSVHRDGLASMRCNPTAATQYIEHQIQASGVVKRTLHRFYLRVATFPSAACSIYGIGQSGFFPAMIRLLTDGTLRLYDSSVGNYVGTDTGAPLALNTWYRVEIDFTDGASGTGAIAAYLNGTKFSGDVTCTVINGFSRIRAGALTAVTGEFFIDDIAVNDTTGTAQTGLPGPGSVVHLQPDAAGDNTGFATTVGGSSNWQRVSEVTPDDATTYNATVATGTTTIDDFNLESSDAAGIPHGATVTLVQVGGRVGSDAATAASIVYRIKSQAAGTVVESASVSTALNGWATHKAAAPYVYQLTQYVDPQAAGPWTKALLDTMQIGYRGDVSQTTARRVSALWALVEFIPIVYSQELKDDFSSGTVDSGRWPNSFGTLSVENGRAKMACNTGYNGISSGKIYTLDESYVRAKMYPPAGVDTDTNAYLQLLVKSDVEGTDLAVEIDTAGNYIGFLTRTGYWDATGVYLPWVPQRHSWVRIRETGGNTIFETSVDSVTWVTQRTITSPAYVTDANLEIQFITHREAGTNDFAYFDNVNMPNTSVLKVWNGTAWISRSCKVWDGSAWVVHPMRSWNGTQWKVG